MEIWNFIWIRNFIIHQNPSKYYLALEKPNNFRHGTHFDQTQVKTISVWSILSVSLTVVIHLLVLAQGLSMKWQITSMGFAEWGEGRQVFEMDTTLKNT